MSVGSIDLHTHTSASDGALSPAELVRAASRAGIMVLAITDHDTVGGIEPAMREARRIGVVLWPGIELSVSHAGRNLHLLAYGFDHHDALLGDTLRELVQAREQRARNMVSLLAHQGIVVPWDRVLAQAHGSVGRPHLARVLVEMGYADDVRDAFNRYIGTGCPAYLPSASLPINTLVAAVREAGGEVALAHPGRSKKPLPVPEVMAVLREQGVRGLEVYYPEHDPVATEMLRSYAAREGLWWCGGSDFHGPSRPNHELGSVMVPEEVLHQGPFRS